MNNIDGSQSDPYADLCSIYKEWEMLAGVKPGEKFILDEQGENAHVDKKGGYWGARIVQALRRQYINWRGKEVAKKAMTAEWIEGLQGRTDSAIKAIPAAIEEATPS